MRKDEHFPDLEKENSDYKTFVEDGVVILVWAGLGLEGEDMFPGGGGEIILEKTMEGSRGRRWCCKLVATRSN